MMKDRWLCSVLLPLALIFALAPSAIALDGSQLAGTVSDASSGERLARVRIRIDGTSRETVTNDRGEFTFDDVAPGEHTLIAETVGYRLDREQVLVSTRQTTTVAIALTGDTVRLSEDVTVKADPFVSVVPGSPSQIRIGAAEIRNLSSVLLDDPMRSMSTLPGVTSPDDFHAEFSVRGAPFARIGVYLDDVPLRAPTHSFAGLGDGYSISALNDQLLGGMTLMSAAPPPAFGGTIGASMAADTRDGSRDKTSFHASVGVSDVNVVGEGPLTTDKRGSWFVAARRSHLAYVTRQLGGNGSESVTFQDVQGKTTYDVTPQHTLSLHVLAGTNSYESGAQDTPSTADVPAAKRFGPNPVFGSTGSTDLVKANWRYTPASTIVLSTTAVYQHTQDEADSQTNVALASSQYSDAGGQANLTWAWRSGSPLRVGFAAHRSSENGTSYLSLLEDPIWRAANAYQGTAHSLNAYAEQEWESLAGRLRLTGGLRWQRNSRIDEQPILPFASAMFQLTRQSKIEFGWGHYAQFPEIDMIELARANAPLSPQTSTHYVAAFERRLGPQTRLRVEAYAREDRNVLDAPDLYPRLQAGGVTWPTSVPRWTNAYDGYSRGVEVILQRRSASKLTGWVGYTLGFNRARDLATGAWFDSDTDIRHALNLYGSYRLTPSVNLSARFNYASGSPVPGYFSVSDFTTGDSTVVDARNASRMPSYQRLDLRLNKSFVHDRWKMTLYAEALNATNDRNLRYMGVGGNLQDQAWPRFGSMAPLLPSVGISVDF
ncbi:MAG TPA: TonB-dependent receptor [Vicinamibacterales bacterium]|jgi:hypothetical protein|nr:TonB-dependent receptor [Vicinamibacterales bacterium]